MFLGRSLRHGRVFGAPSACHISGRACGRAGARARRRIIRQDTLALRLLISQNSPFPVGATTARGTHIGRQIIPVNADIWCRRSVGRAIAVQHALAELRPISGQRGVNVVLGAGYGHISGSCLGSGRQGCGSKGEDE